MSKKAVIVLSGGQDSTTCLFHMKSLGYELHAITFDYNQRHSIELAAAEKVAQLAEVASHKFVKLGPVLEGTSPLVSDNSLEQYRDYQSLSGGLEKTFVPMRNQLFLTIAANRAFVLGCNTVVTGVCEEDFGGYPDCRQSFIRAFAHCSSLGTFTSDSGFDEGLNVLTPLMSLSKKQSVELAWELTRKGFNAYGALAYSHTSYDGHYPPTGHDHATLLRAKGFEEAGIPDPLILRAWIEGLMELPDTPTYQKPLEPYIMKLS